ncbi:transposase [Paeniglutamicibacter psychrophenolicus]|uniref:Transposase YbfD/YdcC n=1 Tax=Paeniglutamicibacter psychrophenolicus TaxID=257454 RepID=A0ABS4WE19_9MICC|nr:transposase [Paeniglutamicibacter psychrophenolicus]MBP2374436.1 putative transposase YbfD/YdcC [Paeniglutamicibacter psychrophenolicus]
MAIDQDTHAVLAQVSVGEKNNEIPLSPVLMEHFQSLTDVAVTADALHTQTGHAHYLAGRGAHYIFTVKENQPKLFKQLSETTWEQVPTCDGSSAKANERQIIRSVKCAALSPGTKFPAPTPSKPCRSPGNPGPWAPGSGIWKPLSGYIAADLPGQPRAAGGLGAWSLGH